MSEESECSDALRAGAVAAFEFWFSRLGGSARETASVTALARRAYLNGWEHALFAQACDRAEFGPAEKPS